MTSAPTLEARRLPPTGMIAITNGTLAMLVMLPVRLLCTCSVHLKPGKVSSIASTRGRKAPNEPLVMAALERPPALIDAAVALAVSRQRLATRAKPQMKAVWVQIIATPFRIALSSDRSAPAV